MGRLRIWMLAIAATVLCGCSKSEPDSSSIDLEIRHVSAEPRWLAVYRPSHAVSGLVFLRQKDQFRSRNWTVLTPGARIVTVHGFEVLISDKPAGEFKIAFGDYTRSVFNDYPFMTSFSDGSMSLYSGHLQAVPLNCGTGCSEDAIRGAIGQSISSTIRFTPSIGEFVHLDVEPSAKTLIRPAQREGTLAYFGTLGPSLRPVYSAIFDPGLPAWVRNEVETLFPTLLQYYERKTGLSLAKTPLLIFPYTVDNGSAPAASEGAVVNRQVQLALFGKDWETKSQDRRLELAKLLAHEAFHLWNAYRVRTVDRPGDKWLHEGGADAAALQALRDLGIIDQEAFAEARTEALNRCMVRLGDATLPSAEAGRDLLIHYDCGAVMTMMAAGVGDSLEFWSGLLREAGGNGGVYTVEMFFSLVHRAHGSEVQGALKSLADGENEAADHFFVRLLYQMQWPVTVFEEGWPDWYDRFMGERALKKILKSECGDLGFYSFTDKYVRLVGDSACSNLKGDYRVTGTERRSLKSDGAEVYDLIQEQCALYGSASLSLYKSRETVEVRCGSIPRRPSFIQLGNF